MSVGTATSDLLRLSEQLAQAEQLRLRRQFDKAESICAALLRQHPNAFGALYTLGLIHADRNDHSKALPFLLRAVMQGPRNHLAAVSLAGVLIENNALDLAAHIVDLARACAPDDPAVLVTLGELSHRKSDYSRAAASFRHALEGDPAFTEAAVGLARSLFALGEMAQGVSVLEDMIAAGHSSIDALFVLSQAPDKLISRDLGLDVARLLSNAGPLEGEAAASVEFVKAGALHRSGQHAQAWAHAREANRKTFARRRNEEKARAARYADSLVSLAKLGRLAPRTDPELPVSLFLLGASRSGKTSLERLVCVSPGVCRHFERSLVTEATQWTYQSAALVDTFPLSALPQGLAGAFSTKYFQLLRENSASSALHTFTNPEDIHDIARLISCVPNVRIVGIKRNLEDNAFRIAMSHYDSGNAYAYDLQATYRHLQTYHRLIDALASAAPASVRVVTYEDMVAAPDIVLKQIAELTGVPLATHGAIPIGDDRGCAAPYHAFLEADKGQP